jgi:phosphate-selective porin OprO and OprP
MPHTTNPIRSFSRLLPVGLATSFTLVLFARNAAAQEEPPPTPEPAPILAPAQPEPPAPQPEPTPSAPEAPTAPAVTPLPAPASAAAEPAISPPVETSTAIKAGAEGFSLASSDKKFALKLRGYAQVDGRFFFDDVDEPPPHTFVLRRVRPIFEGTLFEYFGFRLMPDFGGGQSVIQDAHLDVRPAKEIALRFGKFKPPFGLERLQSATNLLLIERGFPTQLAPNRDIGVQLYGDIADGAASYAVGVFNGVPDGGSADADADEHKDLVARIFLHPLRPTKIAALSDFGIGIAGSAGKAEGTLATTSVPAFRSSGQQTFFRYRAVEDDLTQTVVADGRRNRISPQAYYFYGPVGLLAEYTVSVQTVGVGGGSRTLTHEAWQVSATAAIGGKVSFEGVKPKTSVGEGGSGAFEVSARLHGIELDDEAFPLYADEARSARKATGLTIGAGFWANRATRFMVNYDTTSFEGGAADGQDRKSEKLVLIRSQLSW